MMKDALLILFERDLRKLREEMNLYADENKLWVVQEGISNSAGNLCLHLLGNLNHFIGAILGHSGYVRQRDDEFSLKDIPLGILTAQIDATIAVVQEALSGLLDTDLEGNYPEQKHGETVKMDFMLLHLLGHLSYHLGQINYHRRLIGG
ncbi:MAG: DUF1572 family protein [Lewinellaceae bacterium]|nr:DUF1572 family protein [Lewinellaceae bacterium]